MARSIPGAPPPHEALSHATARTARESIDLNESEESESTSETQALRRDFRGMDATITKMSSVLEALQHQLESMSQRTPAPQSPTPTPQNVPQNVTWNPAQNLSMNPPVNPTHPPDPRIRLPPLFEGKAQEYKSFMAQCTLSFSLGQNTFSTDERKVLFIISQLRGPAFKWAEDIALNPQHPLRHNFEAFKEAMDNVYADRNALDEAEDKLFALRQTVSAAAYASDFLSLAALLDYGDTALRGIFYQGLKPEVKDVIIAIGKAKTLNGLVDQAISYDQRNYQRRQIASTTYAARLSSSHSNRPPIANSPYTSSVTPRTPTPSASNTLSRRPPLTEREKARRRANRLCLYCGQPNHFANTCPELPKHTARVAEGDSDMSDYGTPESRPRTSCSVASTPKYVTKNEEPQ
jgi:hypothetical protein